MSSLLTIFQCCLGLAECSRDEISSLEYKYELLNADLFPVHECRCMQTFLTCLKDLGTQVTNKNCDAFVKDMYST